MTYTTYTSYNAEIAAESARAKKRWNGKVITTGRQWAENASGAREPDTTSFERIYDAVRDYYDSREWN